MGLFSSVIMMTCVSRRTLAFAPLAALALASGIAQSQTVPSLPVVDRTRAELEARARVADSMHLSGEAERIRARLRNGDFAIGDRVIVSYDGVGLQRSDTLVVQAGKILRLGQPMGDLALQGVLRSEVGDSVPARVGKYMKNVVVHATPLVRVAMGGAVHTPGFYYARADMLLSDFIMHNGGQDPEADLSTTTIRRGQQTVWNTAEVQSAMREGVTLDGLNLGAADEIVVGTREASVWPKVLQYGLPLASAVVVQLMLRR